MEEKRGKSKNDPVEEGLQEGNREVGRKKLESRGRVPVRVCVCVCVCFPSGSLGPAAAVLICRWSEGWKGRTEEEEGGIEGGRLRSLPGGARGAAVDCWK